MPSTQDIIQVYKSPEKTFCLWLWGVGEKNGAVTCGEHVQADLNGCWYSDFPQELLSGLCRCFRFQREAINAQPVDLIHMYGWLFCSVQLLPPCLCTWLSQGLLEPKLVPRLAKIEIEKRTWQTQRTSKMVFQGDYSDRASVWLAAANRLYLQTKEHKRVPVLKVWYQLVSLIGMTDCYMMLQIVQQIPQQ